MKFVTQWIFKDLNEEVPRLAQNEVRDIETQGQSCRFFMETRLEDLRDTRKRLQEIGTSVYSIHGPFGKEWQILSASDPAARARAVETYRDLLPKARLFETRVVVVHSGILQGTEGSERRWDLLRESLLALEALVVECGVTLAMENVYGNYEEVSRLVERINAPWFRACYDVGHAHFAGRMWEGLARMGPYLGHLHVHDNDGTNDQHRQPPGGAIDWPRFMRTVKELRYSGAMTLEALPRPGADHKTQIKEVSEFFRALDE